MKATSRDVDGVKIIKLDGKVTIGAGDTQLREVITTALDSGKNQILLDLSGVTTIDSSGIGELVGSYTTVTNRGGKLKLLHLPAKLNELLHVTQLITVFEVYEDEQEAVKRLYQNPRPRRRRPGAPVGASIVAAPCQRIGNAFVITVSFFSTHFGKMAAASCGSRTAFSGMSISWAKGCGSSRKFTRRRSAFGRGANGVALGFCMMFTCAAALKLFLPPDGMAIRRGRNSSPGISEPMSTVTVNVSGS